ncbi:MAG: hypothetical protein IJA02_00975 [Clostridia bacterium]|nr:hypothetical protein [Clostridia bacterium]
MKFLFKLLMVVVLMVAAVVGFETLRLGSVDDAIDCVVQVLNVEELSEGLEDAVSDIDIPSLSGPRGTYYCGSNSLEFRSDGTVISTFLGLQEKGKFSMDGNEITYSGGGIDTIGVYDSENETVTFAGQLYSKN